MYLFICSLVFLEEKCTCLDINHTLVCIPSTWRRVTPFRTRWDIKRVGKWKHESVSLCFWPGVPGCSSMFGKKKKRLEISAPSNFEHRVHTGFDPREQKFTGLPQQWQSLLADTANRPKPMVDPSYITPIQLAPMKVRVWMDRGREARAPGASRYHFLWLCCSSSFCFCPSLSIGTSLLPPPVPFLPLPFHWCLHIFFLLLSHVILNPSPVLRWRYSKLPLLFRNYSQSIYIILF